MISCACYIIATEKTGRFYILFKQCEPGAFAEKYGTKSVRIEDVYCARFKATLQMVCYITTRGV